VAASVRVNKARRDDAGKMWESMAMMYSDDRLRTRCPSLAGSARISHFERCKYALRLYIFGGR
jgi:hypothetical protein